MKCVCKKCGEEFTIIPSRIKRGGGKYCSKKCKDTSFVKEKSPAWKGGKTKCICKICGEEFYRKTSEVNRGYNKYCSNRCMGISRITKIKCVCVVCGKEFFVTPTQRSTGMGKYCSKICSYNSHRAKYVCVQCGKEFFRDTWKVINGDGLYCSTKCVGANRSEKQRGENNPCWKGGLSFFPYCEKFNDLRREAVREFFGRRCLICGSDEIEFAKRLSVHHIDHDKEQGCNGKPFNLVPLCIKCHAKEICREEEYKLYINKTLSEGFKWGIWNEEEYIKKVMYPDN